MAITLDNKVLNIVKALAYTENGGKPSIKGAKAGKTGEMKSVFQFTPDTWKIYAKQASGKELPMNPENESTVVYAKVADWLKQGYSTEQIASMWNAGDQRPDAYKQNWKGMNKKYGVAYDTPAYAKKVANYVKQFEKEPIDVQTQKPPIQGGLMAMSNVESTTPSPAPQSGLMTPPMKQAKQV